MPGVPGERFGSQMPAKNAHDLAVAKTCSAGVSIAQRGSGLEGGSCWKWLLMCSPPKEASWDSRPSMATNGFPNPGQLRANALLELLAQVYWHALPVSSNQSRPSTDMCSFLKNEGLAERKPSTTTATTKFFWASSNILISRIPGSGCEWDEKKKRRGTHNFTWQHNYRRGTVPKRFPILGTGSL